jgi:hypothetical protein
MWHGILVGIITITVLASGGRGLVARPPRRKFSRRNCGCKGILAMRP